MNTPAMPTTIIVEEDGCRYTKMFPVFTKLESACIQLKVTHPDAPEWLNELIKRSKEQDLAKAAMQGWLATYMDTTERNT